jgi:hypothetical protein
MHSEENRALEIEKIWKSIRSQIIWGLLVLRALGFNPSSLCIELQQPRGVPVEYLLDASLFEA